MFREGSATFPAYPSRCCRSAMAIPAVQASAPAPTAVGAISADLADLADPAGELAAVAPIAVVTDMFVEGTLAAVERAAVAHSDSEVPVAPAAQAEERAVPILDTKTEVAAAQMTVEAVPIPVVPVWLAVVAVAVALVAAKLAAMNLAGPNPGDADSALVMASGSPDSAALRTGFPRHLWQPEPPAPCGRYGCAARHTGR